MPRTPLQDAWTVYGSELSPFTLKVLVMCAYERLAARFLPADGGWLENLRVSLRKTRLVQGRLPLTYPKFTPDDEFPLVPFLFGRGGENLYDSTAIGEWLDAYAETGRPLIPREDPALAFLVRLIDEFADEWMLYLVHHFRWKVSAADNDAGHRLAQEFRTLAFGWRWPVARFFSARQVRRLPYLFSVAPEGFSVAGLPRNRQPPAPTGFPPTHALLEDSYRRILLALERIVIEQPYLFGGAPTLADFSIYGQIGMNLADPSANAFIAATAPSAHRWVERLHRHEFAKPASVEVGASEILRPLLVEICRVYVPLMQQNAGALERFRGAGETRFNEAAFDAGRCLYDGEIAGTPFRSVAKTFQAKTWRRLCEAWNRLSDGDRRRAETLLPPQHRLGQYSTEEKLPAV